MHLTNTLRSAVSHSRVTLLAPLARYQNVSYFRSRSGHLPRRAGHQRSTRLKSTATSTKDSISARKGKKGNREADKAQSTPKITKSDREAIYILGVNAHSIFMAHAIATSPNPPRVILLVFSQKVLDAYKAAGQVITVYNHMTGTSSKVSVEMQRVFQEGLAKSSSGLNGDLIWGERTIQFAATHISGERSGGSLDEVTEAYLTDLIEDTSQVPTGRHISRFDSTPSTIPADASYGLFDKFRVGEWRERISKLKLLLRDEPFAGTSESELLSLSEYNSLPPIFHLIVCCRERTIPLTLKYLRRRVGPETTILFSRAPIGSPQRLVDEYYPNPETRPNIVVGSMSQLCKLAELSDSFVPDYEDANTRAEQVSTKDRHSFHVHFSGEGKLVIGCENVGDSLLLKSPAGFARMEKILLSSQNVRLEKFPLEELRAYTPHRAIQKLVLGPLAVLFSMSYYEVVHEMSVDQSVRNLFELLFEEVAKVLVSTFPNLTYQHLQSRMLFRSEYLYEGMPRTVEEVSCKLGREGDGMHDWKWLLKRAEQTGIEVPVLREILTEVNEMTKKNNAALHAHLGPPGQMPIKSGHQDWSSDGEDESPRTLEGTWAEKPKQKKRNRDYEANKDRQETKIREKMGTLKHTSDYTAPNISGLGNSKLKPSVSVP